MKPSPQAIRSAPPLSSLHPDAASKFLCGVCGQASEQLGLWREHDEFDRATETTLFVGVDHPRCRLALDEHPRLYTEEQGRPGTFPLLCGACTRRRGHGCTHPDLKSNGGPGLRVNLSGIVGIICGGGRCRRPLKRANECAGRQVAS